MCYNPGGISTVGDCNCWCALVDTVSGGGKTSNVSACLASLKPSQVASQLQRSFEKYNFINCEAVKFYRNMTAVCVSYFSEIWFTTYFTQNIIYHMLLSHKL